MTKDWLCGNWRCPARSSCARHFGRSDHYRAMTDPLKLPPMREPVVDVDGGEQDCEDYRRDVFKAWLVTTCAGGQNIETPPGWMAI